MKPTGEQGAMTTKQQNEALRYFEQHAEDWQHKALSADLQKVNVIRQRNGFVLDVIESRASTDATLDVGCGTGDLVCDIARRGIDATGIDFADTMIDIARATAKQEKLEKAHFYCSSIFDFDITARRYDVVSANGFIEYISLDDLNRFLDQSYHGLNPGGSFVLGSRNRLFNIFSINSFTLEEIDNGAANLLLREATALASGVGLAALSGLDTAPLQKQDSEHARTGIQVATRYQFTPAQLAKLLHARGFTLKQLYPIHIHTVPPAFKELHPDIHVSISNMLQNFANEQMCLVPYSSSFMIHAERER